MEPLHTKNIDRPEAAQIAASMVAIGLHHLGGAALSPEALAAAWAALLLPVIQIGIRILGKMAASVDDEVAP